MFDFYQRINFTSNMCTLPVLPTVNKQVVDYLSTEIPMAMGALAVTSELRLRSSLKEE